VHFFCFFGFWGVWSAVPNRPDRFVPRVGACSGGVCICAGVAPVSFGGLSSLLEHGFVSNVSSRCPCLRVRDLSSSSDLILCLSRLSIVCWSFFLFVSFLFLFL
jgi:hypothetical protein